MAKLIRNSELSAEQFVALLKDQQISVFEEIQGNKIFVSYVMNDWEIRPKSVNGYAINMVDLATQKYYKWAYGYLISLPESVTNLLKPGYSYLFEYFPDEQPANIAYDRKPKNGLILTSICKYGKYYSYDQKEIKVMADLFGVDTLPEIYRGKLLPEQIDRIVQYLHTGERDRELLWKEKSFAEFFYKTLNPQLSNSFLKDGWQTNMEKIIIRFLDSNSETTLEILNPMYSKMQFKTDGEFSDVYSILIFNFIQWLQTVNIKEIDAAGTSREIIYINLISKLFNMYMQKYSKNIDGFEFSVPEFFNRDKFKINTDLIQNRTTKEWIDANTKFEYVFKILLSSFQRERKKPIGIINEIVLGHLNKLIKAVGIRVEDMLNWNQRLDQFSFQQKDLSKFPNIKWEEDNKGYINFPDIASEFDNGEDKKKKITNTKGFQK